MNNWCLAMGPTRQPEDEEYLRTDVPHNQLFVVAPDYIQVAPVCLLEAGHAGRHSWEENQ